MTLPKLAEFVVGHLSGADTVPGETLELTTVADVRAYQTLAGLGLAMSSDSRRLQASAAAMGRGFRVTLADSSEPEGTLILGRPFTIERRKAPTGKT